MLSVLGLLTYLGSTAVDDRGKLLSGLRPAVWFGGSGQDRPGTRPREGSYQVDDQRRVAVPSDQRDQAETAIAKLELGPRLPGEIRDQLPAAQIWESPRDKEVRENQEQAKILEAMIGDLPGIVGSFVWINRPKPRLGLQPVAKPSAFVRLETEGDRQLPFRTVQSITTILTGYEPGLTADAVTVLDRRGHKYLDAGNPTLSILSHNRAREEELSQEILEQLDWIKGVRVSVQLPETADGGKPGAVAGPGGARAAGSRRAAVAGQGAETRRGQSGRRECRHRDQQAAGSGRGCSLARRLRLPPGQGVRPSGAGPDLGEGSEELLLSGEHSPQPQGTVAGGAAEAGCPDGRADQDRNRAGRAARPAPARGRRRST